MKIFPNALDMSGEEIFSIGFVPFYREYLVLCYEVSKKIAKM